MRNRTIVALLSVIAVLLGANLLVGMTGTAWAQRTVDRDQERPTRGGERPTRPDVMDRQERPTRPAPQREPRCVGITSVGNTIVLAFEDGSIDTRSIPNPR